MSRPDSPYKGAEGRPLSILAHIGLFSAVLALILVAGCSGASQSSGSNVYVPSSSYGGSGNQAPQSNYAQPGQYGGGYLGGTATGDTPEGAQFAQWVLQQDPQQQYITDAIVRGDQTLGVKVQPTATKGDVQKMLVALAQGMARTFPGKPLTVIAFYQSGDKLAQANYDPSTNQVNVQFLQ